MLTLQICKRRLLLANTLHGFLSDDIIQLIYEHSHLTDNIIHMLIQRNYEYHRIKQYLYSDLSRYMINYYERYWKQKYSQHFKLKHVYNGDIVVPILPFINDTHVEHCHCDQCILHIDYPRYSYLMESYKENYRGYTSRQLNHWLYFILSLHCTGYNDNDRNNLSGFCSHYERRYNYKINKYKVYNENIFLKNNKSKWKQLEQAWKSFL
jgi:hypothetical protein